MLSSQAEVRAMDMRRDPNILVMLLARQYRAERNFWLSVFTISSWSALWVIYQVGGCVFLGGVGIVGVWWLGMLLHRTRHCQACAWNVQGSCCAGHVDGLTPA